ncbi:MAG: NAD-dependent deacylase [Crocinitomicaceae bacterium]|nr:NAD-dependent deacylase [Crocinitomicaceae bacterium]
MKPSKKKKIVLFSGAGISAESGIQTFRDSNGLWEQHKLEDVATPEAWKKDPDLVTRFYNERRKQIMEVMPNSAHEAISKLEESLDVSIITQNIDDLHERAGSTNIIHLHGNIRYSKSSGPDQESQYYPIDGWQLTESDKCPRGYRLRPHVVWFGEDVPAYETAAIEISSADILIVVGTSLQVHPAAGLINFASTNAQKFIVDPNADQLVVPPDFQKINKGASQGIIDLIKILT